MSSKHCSFSSNQRASNPCVWDRVHCKDDKLTDKVVRESPSTEVDGTCSIYMADHRLPRWAMLIVV